MRPAVVMTASNMQELFIDAINGSSASVADPRAYAAELAMTPPDVPVFGQSDGVFVTAPSHGTHVVWNRKLRKFFRHVDGRPVLLTKERAAALADAWSRWVWFGDCVAVPWDEQARAIAEGGLT